MSPDSQGITAGEPYWFVSTPAIKKGGVLHSRMIGPFRTEQEARDGADLLNKMWPPGGCLVGQLTYTKDHRADQVEHLFRAARGDLAEELAGPDPRAPQKPDMPDRGAKAQS